MNINDYFFTVGILKMPCKERHTDIKRKFKVQNVRARLYDSQNMICYEVTSHIRNKEKKNVIKFDVLLHKTKISESTRRKKTN